MGSPLDAIGAAAAILQLVQFGISISVKAVEIYKSKQGLTKEVEEVSDMTVVFRNMNAKMIARYNYDHNSATYVAEKELEMTARECDQVVVKFLGTLEDLMVKKSRNPAKYVWGAIRSEQKQAEIRQHHETLQRIRQRLNEQILRLINDKTSAIYSTLQQLEHTASGLASNLPRLKQELLHTLTSRHDRQTPDQLVQFQNECETLVFRQGILDSLKFKEIRWRRGAIVEPTDQTCQWIFDSSQAQGPSVQYVKWLEQRNGVFWITGKAGSGKSTLMKYIANHPRTEKALQIWAAGRRLLTSSHHFWYLGSPIERSHEGLLRSILYHILRACPELIDDLCVMRRGHNFESHEMRNEPWDLPELRQCLMRLGEKDLAVKGSQLCICLFVDGLDEYDDEQTSIESVIGMLRTIANSDNVKVCVSSRPWEIFQQSFKGSVSLGHHLVLQKHTATDILKFIEHEINPSLVDRSDGTEEIDRFKSEVVTRADGVFLWVALVIKKELKPGLLWGDSIDELMQRLNRIPRELGDYFDQILSKIDTFYRKQTARIFLTCMRAVEPLPIQVVRLIMDDDPPAMAIKADIDKDYSWTDSGLFADIRRQVNGRCQDLLEIDPPEPWPDEERDTNDKLYRIRFLHRSVEDFLGQTKMWDRLHEEAGTNFNAEETLLAANILLIKKSKGLSGIYPAQAWSFRALFHASKLEDSEVSRKLLQELDAAMEFVSSARGSRSHWTNWLVRPKIVGMTVALSSDAALHDDYNRDFLGHLIELGLTSHAAAIINTNGGKVVKQRGRPYLDYALRASQLVRNQMKQPISPHTEMVKLLLSLGCRADEKVWVYDGRTVWDLYIRYLHDVPVNIEESKAVVWMLIPHGAHDFESKISRKVQSNGTSAFRRGKDDEQSTTISMRELLTSVFGGQDADAMCEAVSRNKPKSRSSIFSLWSS